MPTSGGPGGAGVGGTGVGLGGTGSGVGGDGGTGSGFLVVVVVVGEFIVVKTVVSSLFDVWCGTVMVILSEGVTSAEQPVT